MRKFSFIYLTILVFLVNACSDDPSSPSNDSGNGGNGDTSSFAVISVDKDTVTWGDTVTVMFKNAQTTNFALFLHTVPVPIDQVWSDAPGKGGIRFRVPVFASSGAIRLFEHDTVLAKNAPSLHVIEEDLQALFPQIFSFAPQRAQVGDLIVIHGSDIPQQQKHVTVSVDDKPLLIVGQDREHIFARVPPGLPSGQVNVTVLGSLFIPGYLEIIENTRTFLEEKQLSKIRFAPTGMDGFIRHFSFNGSDTTISDEPSIENMDVTLQLWETVLSTTNDSIVFTAEFHGHDISQVVEVRLKLEPDNRVSGVIRIGEGGVVYFETYEAQLKNMRWMFVDGVYRLYTHSLDLPKDLAIYKLTLAYRLTQSGVAFTYIGGNANSSFIIDLIP